MSARAAMPLLVLCAALGAHCRSSHTGDDAGERRSRTESDERDDTRGGPRFATERVELTLSEGRVAVHGSYTFQLPGQRAWRGRIGYPILVGEGQAAPDHVKLDGNTQLPVRCRTPARCAAVFSLDLSAGETRTVSVDYEQQITGNRAAYLIVSARRWKRPLERAEFAVHVPSSWRRVELSYPVDSESLDGDQRTLRFERRDFRPTGDLVVTWSE